MFELVIFFVALAIIRSIHRLGQNLQRSVRIDIYHYWPHGGPGERRPEDRHRPEPIGANVVPPRRR